jgi:non-heme chloroperoxidase
LDAAALKSGFVNAYECIRAFSETDFTDDMKGLNIPVLILHGELDQVVPVKDSALQGIKLLKKGTLKIYPGGAHALPQTATQEVNHDLLAFIRDNE